MNCARFFTGAAFLTLLHFSAAHAAPVSSWTKTTGGSAITGLDTASPVFGDGTASSGNGYQIYAALPETWTLAAVGDSLSFSGSVSFTIDGNAGSDQFRFGLFDTHGSNNNTGWLGYFATNSGTGGNPNGRLWERKDGNTTAYFNNADVSASELQAFAGNPATTFGTGTYAFSLSLERTDTGLRVTWSITGTGSTTYSIGGTYNDATPLTWSFDRVGLMSGGGLNAAQASFSDINATFASAVPEPSTWAMLAALFVLVSACLLRRHSSRM
ncbi:glycosyltransferase family 1 [Opitutaceae bacterium TAV5]|nr:glycosyltransferase family 1 [Opitutaceae bacterium TAV5]